MRNNQERTRQQQAAAQPSPSVVAAAPMTYAVPTEFVELPSRGMFYPEGHPLQGQETVEIKYMTAKDEDILSSQALLKKGIAIDRLVQNLMVLDVDPDSLLIADKSAIMIAARISSYGQAYKSNVRCENCGETTEYNFDLKKTNLNEDVFDEVVLSQKGITFNDEAKVLEVTLPRSEVIVGIQFIDGLGERVINDGIDGENSITTLISCVIASVDGRYDKASINNFIDIMPAADSRFIRGIYADLTPSIDLKQEFVCKECDHRVDMEVPLTAEFFWPG